MNTIPPNAIQIEKPAPKAVSEVQVPPKAYLNFQFSLQGASSTKQGDDLVIDMPDGSKVVCLGYYSNTVEADRPQIAVNGEALPPSALDLLFFAQTVEGIRLEGQPDGAENAQGQQAAGQGEATPVNPAGPNAGQNGQGTAQSGQGAVQSGQGTVQSGQGSASPASPTSTVNDGSFKQDMKVDFLDGINRLPGLDLGSDRGFENTDIEGSGGRMGDAFSTPPSSTPLEPAPAPPMAEDPTPVPPTPVPPTPVPPTPEDPTPVPPTPVPPTPEDPTPVPPTPEDPTPLPPPPGAPPPVPPTPEDPTPVPPTPEDPTPVPPTPEEPTPPPSIDIKGLREEGYDADKNPVGNTDAEKSVSHAITVTLPAGMDASTVQLHISLGSGALAALAPNTDFAASYGTFSYTITDKLDASGNPLSPPQVEITFTYKDLNNSHADIDGLNLGEFIKDTLHYTVTEKGNTSNVVQENDAHFIIEGSNDGPVFRPAGSGPTVGHGEVKEEGVYNDNKSTGQGMWDVYDPATGANEPDFGTHKNTTTIQLGVTDADKNDSHSFTLTDTTVNITSSDGVRWNNPTLEQNSDGSYTLKIDGVACGTLTLSLSGELIFVLDSTSPTVQGMRAGNNASFSFNVTVTDSGGLTDTGDVTLTIHGTNDRPTLVMNTEGGVTVDAAGNGFAKIIENSTGGEGQIGNTVQGSVAGNDVDNGDTAGLSYHIATTDLTGKDRLTAGDLDTDGTIEGLYGTLVLDKATGKFTYTENGTLLPGNTGRETFTLVVKDANGAFTTKDITFEVQGEYNDLVFTDATHDVVLQEPGVQPGNTPALGKGEATGNILQDASGKPTFTDSDASLTREYTLVAGDDVVVKSNTVSGTTQTIVTEYGTLTFDITTGAYTYTLTNPDHPDIHKLLSSQQLTEHFTLQVTKDGVTVGSNLSVEVTIKGMNDMPTITVVDTGGGVSVDGATGNGESHLTESGRNAELHKDEADKHNAVSGKLTAGDADAGDSHTFHIVNTGKTLGNTLKNGDLDSDGKLDGSYGTLVLDKNTGTFTYTENGKLAASATGTDTFTVLVKDKDGAFVTKELTFTVTGQTNKVEVVGDNYAIDLKESGVQPGGNTPDAGKSTITGNVATSQNGKANIIDNDNDPTQWSFQLKVHAEDAGKGWTHSTSADGITITYTTAYGTLVFNTHTGDYTYTLNDSVADHLPQGSTFKEKFVVTVSKAGVPDIEQDFVINIAGTNDAPIIAVDTPHIIVTEDVTPPTTPGGKASNTDVDDGDTHSYSIMSGTSRVQVLSGEYGLLRIDPNTGEYTYELDNTRDATQQLGRDQTGEESFTIRVTDKNGAFSEVEIKVTVKGTLDTPKVSYAHGVVTEDGGLDADGNEVGASGYKVEGSANVGTVDSIHKNAGAYRVVDASGNELGSTDSAGMQTITTANGTLVFNTHTGAYTYTMNAAANAAHQHLNIQDSLTLDGFIVRATFPNASGSSTVVNANLTIDIKGINDAPEFTGPADNYTLNIVRTHPLADAPSEGKTATATDVDNNDLGDAGISANTTELVFCFKVTIGGKVEYVQSINTAYGSVTINAQTGAYEYYLNNLHGAVRGLKAGESLNDQFSIVVRDPHGAEDERQVKVTINGIDDPAGPGGGHDLPELDLVVKEDSGGITQRPPAGIIKPGQEDGSGNGTSNPDAPRYAFKDADGNISLSAQGKYGTVYIDAYTGKYRYVLDNQHSAVQMLAAGQFVNEFFNVHAFKMSADGSITWLSTDSSPKGTIKVTVEGANDIPELNHENVAAGIQVFGGATGQTTSGKFQHENIDVDATDKPRFNLTADYAGEGATTVTGVYSWGTVTLNTLTGEYSYTLTKVVNTSVTEKFVVWVNDNNGGVVKEEVSITISPSNARPVVVKSTFTEGYEGDGFSYAYGENPNLGVNTSTGNITLDGVDLPEGATLGGTVLETTTNLKGSLTAWDYEVDVSHTANASAYKYYLCDADGSNLRALEGGDFGTLDMGQNGTFTFTLNNRNSVVMALKEGETKDLTYHVLVRDANGVLSGVEDFTITIEGTNNQPLITVDTPNITMDEDSVMGTVGNITVTDPDLDISKAHDFDLTGVRAQSGGATSNLIIAETHNGNEYSFTVKDSSGVLGVFNVKIDSTDPTKATYWFDVDPSVAGRLSATDNITLEFKLTFDDGQVKNSSSEAVGINVTIQGKDGGGIVTSSFAANHNAGDVLPDADEGVASHYAVEGEGDTAHHAPAPLTADSVSELLSGLVSSLAAPDTTLHGTAPMPLVAQGNVSEAATGTGPALPLTLETPLGDAPPIDMTSAPGQEALQFQLQTTGV